MNKIKSPNLKEQSTSIFLTKLIHIHICHFLPVPRLYCPRLPCLVNPEVRALIRAAVNHLCNVSLVLKLTSVILGDPGSTAN